MTSNITASGRQLESLVGRIADEFADRLARGERPDVEEYASRHPELAEVLRHVLPTIEVLGMLSSDGPSSAGGAGTTTGPTAGVLGDFRIIREVGRGGMGIVYEAEQNSLKRRVALKVLPLAGALDPRHLARFRNEALAAAQLHHTNIVPVYAVGCERGVHYYAMQFIAGRTLAQAIAEQASDSGSLSREPQPSAPGLTAGEACSELGIESPNSETPDPKSPSTPNSEFRIPHSTIPLAAEPTRRPAEYYRTIARLGIQAAEALDYAHQQGILHRDIKPANLILDGSGNLWISDFGLARIAGDTNLTMTGDVFGTLRYMSPEQALGQRPLVDQRSDVYSLGATLYELLTLHPAVPGSDPQDILRRIAEDDPAPPRSIVSRIPPGLEAIVLKALEKMPADRYGTAQELADDLRRFVQDLPVRARPQTVLGRFRKWARRNRTLVRIGTAALAVVVISVVAAAALVERERERTEFERRERAAEQHVVEAARRNFAVNNYTTHINLADRAWKSGEFKDALRELDECLPKDDEEDLRGFEWFYLHNALRPPENFFAGHSGSAYNVRLSPDRRLLASAGMDGVRIWDCASGKQVHHCDSHTADVNGADFSPDGTLLATGGDDHRVIIWSTKTWEVLRILPHRDRCGAAFCDGGRLLASAERTSIDPSGARIEAGTVRLWNTATWEEQGTLRGPDGELQCLAVSDDGRYLAAGAQTAYIWDLSRDDFSKQPPLQNLVPQSQGVSCIAFSHERRLVATARDRLVELWGLDDGAPLGQLPLSSGGLGLETVTFSPADSAIVAGGHWHLWENDAQGAFTHAQTFLVPSRTWSAAFIDNETFVTADDQGRITRRQRHVGPDRRRFVLDSPADPVIAYSPDGATLAVAAGDLRLLHLEGEKSPTVLAPAAADVGTVAFSPDGSALASREFGTLAIRDLRDGSRRQLPGQRPIQRVSYSPDGRLLQLERPPHSPPQFLDAATLQEALPPGVPYPLVPITFSRSGGLMACIDWRRSRSLHVWDATGERWSLPSIPECLAFSPDGALLAAGDKTGTVRLWRAPDGAPLSVVAGANEPIRQLEFSPDGRTLAGRLAGPTIKFWNATTGRDLLTFSPPLDRISDMAFSPAGNTFAIAGARGQRREVLVLDAPGLPSRGDRLREPMIFAGERTTATSPSDPRSVLRPHTPSARQLSYVADLYEAQSLLARRDCSTIVRLLGKWAPANGEPDVRGFEWYWLERIARTAPAPPIEAHKEGCSFIRWTSADAGHAAEEHERFPVGLALCPDESSAVVAAGELTIVDLVSGQTRVQFEPPEAGITAAAFTHDGQWLVAGDRDGTLTVRSTADWQVHSTLPLCDGPIRYLIAVPGGDSIAVGHGRGTSLFNAVSGTVLESALDDVPQHARLLFSPAGQSFATLGDGDDAQLEVHSWPSGDLTFRKTCGRSVAAFSPDGTRLALVGRTNESISIFDTRNWSETPLVTNDALTRGITGVVFTPDMNSLVLCGTDSMVRFVHISTRRLFIHMHGSHFVGAAALKFSSDGRFLITAGRQGPGPGGRPQIEIYRGRDESPAGAPAPGIAYRVQSHVSRLFLEVEGREAASGALLTQGNDPEQRWALEAAAEGEYFIRSMSTGNYLDVHGGEFFQGAHVCQAEFSGSDSQRWLLMKSEIQDFYYVVSKGGRGKGASGQDLCLDVFGASPSAGARICIAVRNQPQVWAFVK